MKNDEVKRRKRKVEVTDTKQLKRIIDILLEDVGSLRERQAESNKKFDKIIASRLDAVWKILDTGKYVKVIESNIK